jgi:L-arabinose isomerase
MVDFGNAEAWFVTGSQHLYGDAVLKTVAEHAGTIVKALAASSEIPVKVVAKPVMTGGESIHQLCREANNSELRCLNHMDAHVFSGAHVDCRFTVSGKTVAAFAHAVQSGTALVHDRYGLHEPEPIGAWRPGVRIHRSPDASEAQNRRWLLAGC